MAEPRFDIIAPHSEKYKRHSEGAMIILPDGQLLMGWTAFYGGFHDASPAHILAMRSDDGGETWSEPVLMLENDGKCNVMNVCFAQPGDGSIVMSHVRTDDETCYYSWPFSRKSTDGGHTWTAHKPMVNMETWRGFPANDRMIVHSSGRLIVPFALNTIRPDRDDGRGLLQPARSDDMGETWQLSSNVSTVKDPDHPGASEPVVVERKDGSLLFFNRTRTGTIWAAESRDRGETVSEPWDTGGPVSGGALHRQAHTQHRRPAADLEQREAGQARLRRAPDAADHRHFEGRRRDLDQRQGPGAGPQPQLHVPVADVRRRNRAHTLLAGGVRLGSEVVHQLA